VNRCVALVAALLLVPATATAHVQPKVPEAPAGARFTFSFVVEHGCEDSPTTGLSIHLPDGAFDASPVSKPGWTAQVTEERRGLRRSSWSPDQGGPGARQ
jgi:periplasmic copper chaperone A